MDSQIVLKYQELRDADRLYEILSGSGYDFAHKPNNLLDEIRYLSQNMQRIRSGTEYNFSITLDSIALIGGCGIKVVDHCLGLGQIGYFVDKEYGNRGIASLAVRQLERIGFNTLGLKELQIRIPQENIRSQRVALKCGYRLSDIHDVSLGTSNLFFRKTR